VRVAVLLFAAAVASGPPAYASCATEAMVSPYAFVGTVISTERKDHIATVITDSGQRVTVLGTTAGFRNPSAPPIDATRWAGFTSFIRLMANRPTGTTSVPRLSNLRVRGFGRCRLRTISCPTGFPSTNKPDLWDICSSSVRLRQALCFSSWQVARSSSDSPLEPADSAVRIARTGREV
jgi:hypothetical protein